MIIKTVVAYVFKTALWLHTYVQTYHYYVFQYLPRKLKENLYISIYPKELIGVVSAGISTNNYHFIDNRKIY